MKERKRKSLFEEFFSTDIFGEFDRLFESLPKAGAGYSITVSQRGGKTVVKAKISGNVSQAEIKKELEAQYPGAEIIVEGGKPLIEEVEVKSLKGKEGKKPIIEES